VGSRASPGAPSGRRTPRQRSGDLAEQAVARHLAERGWTVLARNIRVGRSEIDIVAREPGGTLVFVEVRSRTGSHLGAPEESVDEAKVSRLYAAAWELVRAGRLPDGLPLGAQAFRVDLVTVVRDHRGTWLLRRHLHGLATP
jgi:putative endonuclease